jgi:hypothetical protein
MLRLFLFNPDTPFEKDEIATRTKTPVRIVGTELNALRQARLVKSKTFSKQSTTQSGKESATTRRAHGFIFDPRFPYERELREFLLATISIHDTEIARRFARVGKISLIIVGGSFIDLESEASTDILIVGDRINRSQLEAEIRTIEAEIGRDLTYATLTPTEFSYRRSIHDRLIRNVFDFPHRAVLDRLSLL